MRSKTITAVNTPMLSEQVAPVGYYSHQFTRLYNILRSALTLQPLLRGVIPFLLSPYTRPGHQTEARSNTSPAMRACLRIATETYRINDHTIQFSSRYVHPELRHDPPTRVKAE